MIKLAQVKKRKCKKNIYKKSKWKPTVSVTKLIKEQYLNFLGPLFILLFIVFGITVVLQKTIFDRTNYIKHIDWSQESIQLYDNPYLYEYIRENLTGKNVYKLNYFGHKNLLNNIQNKYPVVDDIQLHKKVANSVAVKLIYKKPDILFQLQDRTFGVWRGKILEVFSGNAIAQDILEINLPLYASGVQNIDGIFYDISPKKLLDEMYYIHNIFPQATRIVYMPGSQTTVIFVYNKKVYINHAHDMERQVRTFYGLEKYYTGFQNLTEIDLGSLEEGEAIVI